MNCKGNVLSGGMNETHIKIEHRINPQFLSWVQIGIEAKKKFPASSSSPSLNKVNNAFF